MKGIKRLLDKKRLLGIFVKIPSTEIIELIAWAGFDFIVVDTEHSPMALHELKVICSVAQGQGLNVIVRPWDFSKQTLLHILDLGVEGIQVPQVNSGEDVISIINGSKYPPLGERGVAFSHRAGRFGLTDPKEYMKKANEETLIAVHIETKESLANIKELMSYEGIDMVFVGPTDLSYSLGVDADFIKGGLKEAFSTIMNEAKKAGKHVGTIVNNREKLEFCISHGINYIVWDTDVGLFKKQLTSIKEVIKQYF